ncbi:MAG TPA: nuclear transport factor 2 family protein, partial [Caldilineaceae bacterium]|nr:nuclear transport factor 2 family protein [Caldilineaceae bacterium]
MIKILSFLGMGLILLSACQSLPQPLAMAVINSWQEALNKGDIERALSYVAEDASVTISPAGPEGDAVFHGHAEIRGWYDTLVGAKGITT